MIKPVKKAAIRDFIIKSEAKSKSPTIFELKSLDSLEYFRWAELVNAGAAVDGILFALQNGLVGWKNFDAPFSEKVEDNVNLLPNKIVQEIAQEVVKRSTLSEKERKNS